MTESNNHNDHNNDNNNGEDDGSTTPSNNTTDLVALVGQLKMKLSDKEQQLHELQRGLETQVHMVMELERLEQNEMRQYELKLQSNQQLIRELGDRLGQESHEKAELQSRYDLLQHETHDQAAQIRRLEELTQTHRTLLLEDDVQRERSTNHHQQQNNKKGGGGGGAQWELYGKLEEVLARNQDCVQEISKKNHALQEARQQVCDQELLALELSSQLDKLATQLNTSDDEMAKLKHQLERKQQEVDRCNERMALLETSILEDNNNNNDDNSEGEGQTGKAALLKALKEKEALLEKTSKERDVSLNKATSLSVALATTREHNDMLQEKLLYQNGIVDRFLGKSHTVAVPTPPQKPGITTATTAASSFMMPGDHIQSNTPPPPPRPTPERVSSREGSNGTGGGAGASIAAHAQSRLRNFFGRARTGSAGSAGGGDTNSTNNNNGTTAAAAAPVPSSPPPSEMVATAATSSTYNNNNNPFETTTPVASATTTKNHNPFDDDRESEFANSAVGKESQIAENSQDGGGDINLALTL